MLTARYQSTFRSNLCVPSYIYISALCRQNVEENYITLTHCVKKSGAGIKTTFSLVLVAVWPAKNDGKCVEDYQKPIQTCQLRRNLG